MTNILVKYLEERLIKPQLPKQKVDGGPVITISRYFGCPANLVASDLADMLTKMGDPSKEPWKVITKEILDESAKELGLEPEKIEYIFKFEKRSMFDEILEAFSSKYYKSERKIRNTIRDVIYDFGVKGRVIIVGRAGSTILQNVPNSLHVRLIAPLDYRIEGVSKRHQITYRAAKKLTVDMDKKRAQLRNDFAGKRILDVDYDLVLNSQTLSTEEIVKIIEKAAELRKLV
ncbi:MAG: AAA family ATPase [Bacteroidales bacterium]